MGKSLLVILLSIAVGLEPFALYPTQAFAEDLEAQEIRSPSIKNLIQKIANAKVAFIRNKIYGDTPGANPALVPSPSQIIALEKELQDLKTTLFADIKSSLYSGDFKVRNTVAAPIEWEYLQSFYIAASELEDLKVLNGSRPEPSTWAQKYGLDIPLSDINHMGFIFILGQHIRNLPLEREMSDDGENEKQSIHNIAVVVQLNDKGLGQSNFEFRLNPLLASALAEKEMVATANQFKMLQLAQMIAANQLYETSALLHTLNKKEVSQLPDISPELKSKFPILEWKRSNYLMVNRINDQRDIMTDLVERKVGALVEKLNKENRNFMDEETVAKVTRALNPKGILTLNDDELKESLKDQLESEQSLPFFIGLRAILASTAFDPAKSKEFWSTHIKSAITQAKLIVALDSNLNIGIALPAATQQKVRQVLLERAAVYQNVVLKDMDVNLVLKYVMDTQSLYSLRRYRFQKDLWLKAKNMEDGLSIQNTPVDLTIIADDDFIELLNSQINRVETQYDYTMPESPTVYTATHVLTRDISPVTRGWLQTVFQPGQSYGLIRANYLKLIYGALADFTGSNEILGKDKPPKSSEIKEWLLKSTYNNSSNLIDTDPLNFLAIELTNKAPQARKQELIELIKIGENLGFFLEKPLSDQARVSSMPWGPAWTKAYTDVFRKRTIAKNPILAVKLSDTAKESAWASIAYAPARTLSWTLEQLGFGNSKKEKTFAEELYPLYNNDPTAVSDDRADAVVSAYLSKVQELVNANLQFLTNVDEGQKVNWGNPLTYSRAFRTNPNPEFSDEFKRIVTFSTVMTANVNQYAQYQMLFQQMSDGFAAGDVWGKAYDTLYQRYVGDVFMATVGLTVMKWITKFRAKNFHELLSYYETEALVPVLGPGLKYFNYSALAWLAGHGIVKGIDVFGHERDLRNQVSNLAYATVDGPGLIDMKMKDKSDEVYNKAHLDWWLESGLFFGAVAVIGTGLVVYKLRAPAVRLKKFKIWSQKILNLADDVGMQAKSKDGKPVISLIEGYIDGSAQASIKNVQELIAKGNAKPNGPRWASEGFFKAHIEGARANLQLEREALVTEWTQYGQRFANHFRALRMEPAQWDVKILNLRKLEIEKALEKKTITYEQFMVLKEYHRELTEFMKPFVDMALKVPEVGGPVLELISTIPARLKFNNAGAITSHYSPGTPADWVREAKKFSSDIDKGMSGYFRAKAGEMGFHYDKANGVGYIRRIHQYSMDTRMKLNNDYLKSLEKVQ